MGIRAPIYIGFLSKDKREKNSLDNGTVLLSQTGKHEQPEQGQ